MTETNVELVREGFEAMREGDVEALLPFIHPDFEVTTPPGLAAEPDTYRGQEGIRRYFESFYEAMDRVSFEADDFIEVGDRVVVPTTLRRAGGRRASRPSSGSRRSGSSRTSWLFASRSTPRSSEAMDARSTGGQPASPRPHGQCGPMRPQLARSRLAAAPSRSTSHVPPSSRAVRSTTVDGSPPARRRRSPGRRRRGAARVDVLEAARRRLAAAIGAGLEDRARAPRERALDQPQPEALRVLAQASG